MAILTKLELAITLTVGIGGGYLLDNYAENLQKERGIENRILPPPHLRIQQEQPKMYTYPHNPLYFIH